MKQELHKVARDRLRVGDLNGAASIVQEGLQGCGDRDASPETWSLRIIWASLLRLGGKTEEALEYLTSKEALYPPSSNDIASIVGLKNRVGHCLVMLGRFVSAHDHLRRAERMAREEGLAELLCEVRQSLGMLFFLQEDYASSDRVFRSILELSDRTGDWYRAVALWGMGKNLMIQGQHQAALPWLGDSLALFEAAGAHLWVATVWGEQAVCHLGMGNDVKALELFQSALRIEAEAGMVGNYQVLLANIGNVYLHREDYLTAIDFYRRALSLAREINDPVSTRKWSRNIRIAYARLCRSVDQLDACTA